MRELEKMGVAATILVTGGMLVTVMATGGSFEEIFLTYEIAVVGIPLSVAGAVILVDVYDRFRQIQNHSHLKRHLELHVQRVEHAAKRRPVSVEELSAIIGYLDDSSGYVLVVRPGTRYMAYIETIIHLKKGMRDVQNKKADAETFATNMKDTVESLVRKF